MNPNMTRAQITPEMVERFGAYYRQHPAWGSLHIVLDDGNLHNHDVVFCIDFAEGEGDTEGAELGHLLLTLTKSQRYRLARRVEGEVGW